MGNQSKEKPDRINLDNTEKLIFWKIIRETEGGKLYKTVTLGTTTPQQKQDVWEMVVAIFYAETGKHLEREKARKLFQRMRTQENKKHDANVIKNFAKECRRTGGGPGPSPPPDVDGDYEENLLPDTRDSTLTPWNQVSRFRGSQFSGPPGTSSSQIPSPSTPRTNTLPQLSCGASVSSQAWNSVETSTLFGEDHNGNGAIASHSRATPSTTETRRPQPRALPFQPSETVRPVALAEADRPVGPLVGPPEAAQAGASTSDFEVVIHHENGTTETVPIARVPVENNLPPKKTKVPTKVDALTAYYTKMLSVQVKQMKLKSKLMREKLLTKKMKQTLLAERIHFSGLEIPVLESSDSGSDGEEEEENL